MKCTCNLHYTGDGETCKGECVEQQIANLSLSLTAPFPSVFVHQLWMHVNQCMTVTLMQNVRIWAGASALAFVRRAMLAMALGQVAVSQLMFVIPTVKLRTLATTMPAVCTLVLCSTLVSATTVLSATGSK